MTSNLAGRTILVVEDEALIAMDISMEFHRSMRKLLYRFDMSFSGIRSPLVSRQHW